MVVPRPPGARYNHGVFELLDESESPDGTTWTVQSIDDSGELRRFRVRLSWPDYDVWSPDGGVAPSRVATAVVNVVLSHGVFDPIPDTVDAALVRRRLPDGDRIVASMIR